MSKPQALLETLKVDWTKCRAHEEQKHTLIENLFGYIESLSSKLKETEDELRDKKDVVRLTRNQVEEAEKHVQECKNEKARHSFVLVLIDGNSIPFRNELIREGFNGGKRVAALLLQTVREELASRDPYTAHQVQVVARIFADVQRLATFYSETGLVSHAAVFAEFVRGFNVGDAMCDYLDVGSEEGRSDEKIQAMFRHGLLDIHCNHLLLGCSAKSECIRFLDPFVTHAPICRQITLLEGPSFAQELAPIKSNFHSVQFRNIFETQGRDDSRPTPSLLPSPPHTPLTSRVPPTTKIPRSKAACPPSLAININSTTPPTGKILQNKQGQRVDLPLKYSSKDFVELKNRKLCNSFYLLGKCSLEESSAKCQHDHTAELSKKQMTVLRAFARKLPCRAGVSCKDPSCISGHRCPQDNCVREKCWFPSQMHDVDTTLVATS